jgi:protein-disulfide isomerase
MPIRRSLVSLLAFALVSPSALPAAPKDAWQEEILLQLSELRKSQGELKQQLTEMRAELTALRAGGGGVRPAFDLRDPQLPSQGSADAQVAIVEFSDFQCPYCRKHAQGTWPQLREKYLDAGRARYFFVDFPLAVHSQAGTAALAAACAHEQGAFWPMHDRLFDNQGKLGPELYTQLASQLNLDSSKFQSCLADPKTKQRIDAHAALGDRAGVQGTPAFLIGRIKDGVLVDARLLGGARAFEEFARIVDQYSNGS